MIGSSLSTREIASVSVSPYLLRPIRTYEQALADIAERKRERNVVRAFVPALPAKPKKPSTVIAA